MEHKPTAPSAWHLEFTSRNLRGVPRPLGGPAGAGQASLADVALHRALAPAAGDVAAPVVPAVAPLDHVVCVGVVAAPAAHEVAAVTAVGRLVALPGGGGAAGEHSHHLQPHTPSLAARSPPHPPSAADSVPRGRDLGRGGF